ncbi:hypothetical protein BT67DRAFT_408036 [Trichocladium antarcticum]|uniref:HMG box domain-containing protein n=1 Tax=Trichocladium antarcticum TaxID=1450529 RepID=A0AAN6UG22_9PEZI|nr:hypothetical protein BT67DRAFT_408036 [Trichocladium antarcticum]
MDRHTPLSPGPIKSEPLPTGFNELMQHNAAAASYAREAIPTDSIQAHSQPTPYGPIPDPYNTPATSPPTPSRASDMMSTRSSNIGRGDARSKVLAPRSTRVEKSTPKKKKERAKPMKNMPHLDRPMSELTKNSSIVVADIDTYVHRSSEARRLEIETGKNPGRVKRPMNAFMLYRKAYQQRAKEWASQHNHQVVSRVCGLSWPLEPEHIRQQFKAWADMERDNHQKAHPNYKFTPSKPQKTPKFEPTFDDHSDGPSDLEDYEWSGRAGSRMRSATNTPNDDSDYIPSRSVYAATHQHQHPLAGLHGMAMQYQSRAALDYHTGRPMTASYDPQGQYYETHIRNQQQRHLHHSMVEEAMIRKTPSPSMAFQNHPALHSQYDHGQYQPQAPRLEQPSQSQSQSQHEQHQHQHQHPHLASHFEHRIDPSLAPADDSLFDAASFGGISNMFDGTLGAGQQSWDTAQLASANDADSQFSHAYMGGLDATLSLEQQTQYLRGADEWQIEPLGDTTQFDTSWVDPRTEL